VTRKYVIPDGQIKWNPIVAAHLDLPDSGSREFFHEWFMNNQYKDVTFIRLDGHGSTIQRILLPDCELLYAQVGTDMDASGLSIATIEYKMAIYEPVFLD
jgi:hypothetical protein